MAATIAAAHVAARRGEVTVGDGTYRATDDADQPTTDQDAPTIAADEDTEPITTVECRRIARDGD